VSVAPDGPSPSDKLPKQYELVLQEYRFQVQLNWDRAKHYLVFNTALFGAAVALYKDARTWAPEGAVGLLLLLVALNSLAGQHAVAVGHEYYQDVRSLKTRLEKELGLEKYAIASTPGMKRDHDVDAAGTPRSGKQRLIKIVTGIRALLVVIAVFGGVGATYALHASYTDLCKPTLVGR
jgi:hypothetical protein